MEQLDVNGTEAAVTARVPYSGVFSELTSSFSHEISTTYSPISALNFFWSLRRTDAQTKYSTADTQSSTTVTAQAFTSEMYCVSGVFTEPRIASDTCRSPWVFGFQFIRNWQILFLVWKTQQKNLIKSEKHNQIPLVDSQLQRYMVPWHHQTNVRSAWNRRTRCSYVTV